MRVGLNDDVRAHSRPCNNDAEQKPHAPYDTCSKNIHAV